MSISRAEVVHAARLARLGLEEDEIERMTEQVSHILEAMESLRRLDTSAIPPTAQVIPLVNVMREDEARPPRSPEEILRNAPATRDQHFFVPPVFE